MTYARARLWLGIAGVGTIVVLAVLAVLLAWPAKLFGAWPNTLSSNLTALFWIVLSYTLLHVPFDYIGGYWLPCYYSRQCQLFNMFAAQYLRAAFFQSLIVLLSALVLLEAGRWGGRAAAIAAIAVLMLILVELQDRLARLVGGLHAERDANGVLYLGGVDSGFSGGLTGLPGRERIVLPSLWTRIFTKDVLQLELTRRSAALSSGSRLRGLAVAFLFNLVGFWACSFLPNAGVSTVSELFTTALGFTLWSFLGLLVLPTLSRLGVFELDQAALEAGIPAERFESVVRELDQLQDDEPSRPRAVEAIFHPVPSVENRLAHYRRGERSIGAWNAARYALYLSWPCLGFLSRAVHCNSGRPELWVMLPVD